MLRTQIMLSPALAAKVDSLIQQVEQGKGLVKSGKQIVELLRAEGLVQKLTLPPKCVGVHPDNRDGLGLSSVEVHSLLSDVLEFGFVPSMVNAI